MAKLATPEHEHVKRLNADGVYAVLVVLWIVAVWVVALYVARTPLTTRAPASAATVSYSVARLPRPVSSPLSP